MIVYSASMRTLLFSTLLMVNSAVWSQDRLTIPSGTNDLHRYTLFLKGEFHERKVENENSVMLLAQHLYQYNKLRYLVFEWGPDFSYLANRYLQTQDDSVLFKNNLEYSRAFWDTLVALNRYKPAIDQIKVRGFDFNRSVFTGKAFFIMTKGKAPFPDYSIQSALEKIIKWKDIRWSWEEQDEFVKQMKKLSSLCEKHQSALMAYFGEDWPAFSAIISHDVKSKSTVDRDKRGLKYVKGFLDTKEEGNVLFNYGISHAFLNGIGMGKMLNEDPQYRGKVCSIYPYYQLSSEEKSKIEQRKDSYLPVTILSELESFPSYALVNMEQRGLYPKEYKISQWVYVIPKAKL